MLKLGFREESFPAFRMAWIYAVQEQRTKSRKKWHTSDVILRTEIQNVRCQLSL